MQSASAGGRHTHTLTHLQLHTHTKWCSQLQRGEDTHTYFLGFFCQPRCRWTWTAANFLLSSSVCVCVSLCVSVCVCVCVCVCVKCRTDWGFLWFLVTQTEALLHGRRALLGEVVMMMILFDDDDDDDDHYHHQQQWGDRLLQLEGRLLTHTRAHTHPRLPN